MLGSKDQAEERPDADLRDRLHAMEAKVRKLREVRNNFSSDARSAAEQRNAVQAQYKEHREKLDLMKAELDAIHLPSLENLTLDTARLCAASVAVHTYCATGSDGAAAAESPAALGAAASSSGGP